MRNTLSARLWRLVSPRSLRYQLLSRLLFILSGLLVLIGIFQYVFMSNFLYQNTAQNIRDQIRSVPFGAWLDPGKRGFANDLQRPKPFAFSMSGATVAFIDQFGQFHTVLKQPGEQPAPRLSRQQYQAALTFGQGDQQYQIISAGAGTSDLFVLISVGPPNEPIGVVEVSLDDTQLRRILMQQLIIFIDLALSALVAGLVTLFPTLQRTLIPLSQMAVSVRRVNAGNLDERIALERAQTEIELLANSYNAMLERLSASFAAERAAKEKMRQFVADASHELRTPLTSIHGFLQVLLRGAATQPGQLQKALESMLGESERLTKLVQDLLTSARLDQEPAPQMAYDRLDALVREMEPQLRVLAGERKVSVDAAQDVTAQFDADRIKQVILNLFMNAVQHTDARAGRIEVKLDPDHDMIRLVVCDNGVGIPEEQQERVFERFYRMDSARSRKHGGTGLGLAIAKSIVESHGGTITCTSQPGVQTTFIIRLPRM